jgi:SPP1 gp7 family putative phage head morphogenesis protein
MARVNANPITEKEALDYILEKENRPTHEKSREIALTWDSEAKTRAFFSARVAKADLLEGMRKHITDVVQGRGTTSDARFWIRKFLRTEGKNSLAELGFLPEQEARESDSIIELASTRRLNLIIEQNVRMAHAVGEYAEFMDARDIFPYVEYRTREDAKVRNTHMLLDGMVFRVDDPIMSRICPPQDFRCRCRLRQLSADELGGRKVSGELPEGWKPPESGFSFDVTKGLAQALPEKEQWGEDIKEEFRKEVKNPPAIVPSTPAPRPAPAPINPPAVTIPKTPKPFIPKEIVSETEANIRLDTIVNEAENKGFSPELIAEIKRTPKSVFRIVDAPHIKHDDGTSAPNGDYDPATQTIRMNKDAAAWNGRPSLWHHETGHHIDGRIGISGTPELDKTMQADYSKWQNDMQDKHGDGWKEKFEFDKERKCRSTVNEYKKDLNIKGDSPEEKSRYAAYFDTVASVSGGKYGWGHPKGTDWHCELVANIYMAKAMGWEEFKIAFPATWELIKKRLQTP